MSKMMNDTKVMLSNVRLSYANLFEPRGYDGGTAKYSTAILIDKKDKDTVELVKHAIKNAVDQGKASKWGGKAPANLKQPLRDGDDERPDDDNYAGMYFLNASSTKPPQVVAKYKDPETGKAKQLGGEDVYSGCYVNITINFYPFSVQGNKGVAAGLGNVQKFKDGDRLSGGASADDDFEFDEPEEDDNWFE